MNKHLLFFMNIIVYGIEFYSSNSKHRWVFLKISLMGDTHMHIHVHIHVDPKQPHIL